MNSVSYIMSMPNRIPLRLISLDSICGEIFGDGKVVLLIIMLIGIFPCGYDLLNIVNTLPFLSRHIIVTPVALSLEILGSYVMALVLAFSYFTRPKSTVALKQNRDLSRVS